MAARTMTAIQALDRKDPVLPLSLGRAERHGVSIIGIELCPWRPPSTRKLVKC